LLGTPRIVGCWTNAWLDGERAISAPGALGVATREVVAAGRCGLDEGSHLGVDRIDLFDAREVVDDQRRIAWRTCGSPRRWRWRQMHDAHDATVAMTIAPGGCRSAAGSCETPTLIVSAIIETRGLVMQFPSTRALDGSTCRSRAGSPVSSVPTAPARPR
jgi:hypothetical protein